MNAIEERLSTAIASRYTLCKYHDTEDYDDGLLDVYDYLCDWRDDMLASIDKLKVDLCKNPNNSKIKRDLNNDKIMLTKIEDCIQDVENSQDVYYGIFNENYTDNYFCAPIPIKTCNHELAEAIVDENNVITFKKTGYNINCFILPGYVSNVFCHVFPEIGEINGKPITRDTNYVNQEMYYIYDFVKQYNQMKYILCPDCYTIHVISPKEDKWYADRNMDTPKRCNLCRYKKRTVNKNNNEDNV